VEACEPPSRLLVTMALAFRQLTERFGFPSGYLMAFLLYWAVWCAAVPAAVLGWRRAVRLFGASAPQFKTLDLKTHALLWSPLVFPLVFTFVPRVATVGPRIVIVSVVLGLVIGVAEELLWRGVYLTLFPDNWWLNVIYPSVAFGLWHLCPLSALPSHYPGGAATFVAYSIALGLSYATCARRTRSIFWCTVSHCIHDSLGLGGFAYLAWLK